MGSYGGGAAQGGGQAAESGSIVETQVPVVFEDGSVANLDLQRLKALNSGLLEGMLFTEAGLSIIGEFSEDNPLVMEVFANLENFKKFETELKDPLQGKIADMVDFFKKADFLRIDIVDHLKILHSRNKKQFFDLCSTLLQENLGFVLNMQRAYPEILRQAIIDKEFDFAKMLIAAGADVNVKSNWGWTPLILAARIGHTEIERLLIDAKANVDTTGYHGQTALMMSAELGNIEAVSPLITTEADVNARDEYGDTALMIAVERGHTEIAQLLIAAAGVDVNARDNDGRTALMRAAGNGHTGTVGLLFAASADVHARSNRGETALMLAEKNHHAETAQLLRTHGAC